jgi:hypothetical protein
LQLNRQICRLLVQFWYQKLKFETDILLCSFFKCSKCLETGFFIENNNL